MSGWCGELQALTIIAMALAADDRPIRPLTADEVIRMEEAGILGGDERVELLHGSLTEKPVKTPAHEVVKSRLLDWLRPGWTASAYLVRIEAPLVVRDRLSLPEPDIALVEPRDYLAHHPAWALLVIEVAVTSSAIDLHVKPPLLAAAGVPEMWVVDVPGRRVHVFTHPRLDGYGDARIVEGDATLEPTSIETRALVVAALFEGL